VFKIDASGGYSFIAPSTGMQAFSRTDRDIDTVPEAYPIPVSELYTISVSRLHSGIIDPKLGTVSSRLQTTSSLGSSLAKLKIKQIASRIIMGVFQNVVFLLCRLFTHFSAVHGWTCGGIIACN
jgi:hypothetical protein